MQTEKRKVVDFIKSAFTDVSPSWRKVLLDPDLHKMFTDIVTRIVQSNDQISPNVSDIFNAFRYFEPSDTKVVIIGQDPYINEGEAMGLCFSVKPGIAIPPSLKNIYMALENSNLIKKDTKRTGNLDNWARQGILMLNSQLTTRMHLSDAHKFWKPYTDAIISRISKFPQKMTFLLWGNFAKSKASLIAKHHNIYEWTHPSTMGDNKLPDALKFKNCDHFRKVTDEYKISWEPMCMYDAIYQQKEGKYIFSVLDLKFKCTKTEEINVIDFIKGKNMYLNMYTNIPDKIQGELRALCSIKILPAGVVL